MATQTVNMPPGVLTPDSSGTTTPTTASASALTRAGIKHEEKQDNQPGRGRLDAARLTVQLTSTPRPVPAVGSPEEASQAVCSDHMVTCAWTAEHGWDAPALRPYGPLEMMPTASALQYATTCFEGTKLYRGVDGWLRLFRPDRNCRRLRDSAARIALPTPDPDEVEKLIRALCARDGPRWLPRDRVGHFMYLRPTIVATEVALGVQRPRAALLYVVLACFPDLSCSTAPNAPPALDGHAPPNNTSGTPTGLRLLASDEDTVRAWPGGFGHAKVGANYGPTLVAQGEARARGYDQVLWLFGREGFVTEAGASNLFVVWRAADGSGRIELVTAPLERMILEGVTRASVLELARTRLPPSASGDEPGVEVVERRFTMREVVAARDEGRLLEAFAAGTAFFIAPVRSIHFRGDELELDVARARLAGLMRKWLSEIMYGETAHEWGVVVEEEEGSS